MHKKAEAFYRCSTLAEDTICMINPKYINDITDTFERKCLDPVDPDVKSLVLQNYWNKIPDTLPNLEVLSLASCIHTDITSNFKNLKSLIMKQTGDGEPHISSSLIQLEYVKFYKMNWIKLPKELINIKHIILIETKLEFHPEFINLKTLIYKNVLGEIYLPKTYTNLEYLFIVGDSRIIVSIPPKLKNLKTLMLRGGTGSYILQNGIKKRYLPKSMKKLETLHILGGFSIICIPEELKNLKEVFCGGNNVFHKPLDNCNYKYNYRNDYQKKYNILLKMQKTCKLKLFIYKQQILYKPLYIGSHINKMRLVKLLSQ